MTRRSRFSMLRPRVTLPMAALALALVLSATALSAFSQQTKAQEGTPVPAYQQSTVEVTGTGVVTMTPDTATVSIGVDAVKPSLAAAQAESTQKMTAILNTLKAAGIADKDIQTTNYSVNVLQDNSDGATPGTIKGFEVSNTVNVTVRDLDKVGSLLDSVVAQGANNIYGISFYVNDPSKAASQARTQAVQDAQQKAGEYAAVLGMTVGRVISVSETSSPTPAPQAMAAAAPSAARNVPVEAGSLQISVNVDIVYELQP